MSVLEIQAHQKCRCCTNSTEYCIKIETLINDFGHMDKTYKELWNEVTQLDIHPCKENILPQQICMECCTQLVNSYKFIQQACQVTEQYLKLEHDPKVQDDFKSLQETLMEISEVSIVEDDVLPDLSIECTALIKEEKEESDTAQEERDILDNTSEDSDDPKSLNDNDLPKEPIARRCDICQKVYRNEQILKIHKRYTHMPEEDKIPCPLCTYKANKASSLRLHISVIHGQDKVNEYFKPSEEEKRKKYPCNLCPQSYARKYTLLRHIRRKHENKSTEDESDVEKTVKPKEKERFLCTYCGNSYSFKNSLKTHIRSHTGERPYVCEICNKTFTRLMGLKLHRITHSEEKPYKCNECGKAFKLPDKLKYHMRVHSELRPYKCKECGKAFKYACVLKSHMYVHTGETPFPCKTCGESFAMRTSLNKHCLRRNHEK